MAGVMEAGGCGFSSPMFVTAYVHVTFSSKVQRENMHSNLYLSMESFPITEHIRKLAMFFSSKGLPLYVGCLESFFIALPSFSFVSFCCYYFAIIIALKPEHPLNISHTEIEVYALYRLPTLRP